jgi:hypothetical protein
MNTLRTPDNGYLGEPAPQWHAHLIPATSVGTPPSVWGRAGCAHGLGQWASSRLSGDERTLDHIITRLTDVGRDAEISSVEHRG